MRTFLLTTVLSLVFTLNSNAQTTTANLENTTEQTEVIPTEKVLKVSGLNCGNDLKTLVNKVADLKGVNLCEPVGKLGAKTKIKVQFDEKTISLDDIKKALESTPSCTSESVFPYKVK